MKRLIKALFYSIDGIKQCFKSETAFRQEVYLSIILSAFIIYVDISLLNKAFLASSLILVLIAELINTAVETLTDRISEEKHELSKKAKDVASAVVLLSIINAIIIWVAILL